VSESSIHDVEGSDLATHFVKEVQSTLRHRNLRSRNTELASDFENDIEEASTSRVTKDIDTTKDVVFVDVDAQGTEFRQSDEKSMNHLEDRRKRTLAQHNLDCGKGVSVERDLAADDAGAEDDYVEREGHEFPASDVHKGDLFTRKG
jgi:predicted DNA binding protein